MTGKTYYLAKQIERAAEKHGAENVIVASYTKAAATTLINRDLPIPRENVGTLHALCYRALKGYEIAEVNGAKFNEEHPSCAITVNGASQMDEMAADAQYATDGDRFLSTYNLYRAKCLPLETMPKDVITWVKTWESWKMKHKFIDFTDMITITLSMDEPFPGEPSIGIYDEVQDFNKLELQLVRHWGAFQNHIILAGDDDQTIYDFCGASPDAFLYPEVSEEYKRVLRQSYRLPKKVHDYSQKWIKQITNRATKEFDPKKEEGSVEHVTATFKNPDSIIELAGCYAQEGKSVMILASCGYLLNNVKTQLRAAGLPFHNPYRTTRGDWNPMGTFHRKQGGHISTRERILSFLDESMGMPNTHYWGAEDLSKWVDMIRIRGILKKGAKDKIASIIENHHGFIGNEQEFYSEIFEDFALQRAIARDIKWFKDSLLSTKRSVVEYPLTVYQKQGRAALESKPKIILGTIHSVKGGEADVVILFPDLSLAAMNDYEKSKDATIRTFYVGMTRAKESLILCQANSDMSVQFN